LNNFLILLSVINHILSIGGKGGKAPKKGYRRPSKSARSGLQFPVGRVYRYMKKSGVANRIGAGAPVYLTAVLEYLCAEVLELAGNAAKDNKKVRINPRHILLAIQNDEELNKLCKNCTIPSGGVLPNLHSALFKPKKSKSVPFSFQRHSHSQWY